MPKIPQERQIVIDTEYLKLKRPDFVRAARCDLDAMISLYRSSRAAAKPEIMDGYPSFDRIEQDIEDGYLWYAREDGEIIGACAVTPEPVFEPGWEIEELIEEVGRFPGEDWFKPGEKYISVLRQAAKPGVGPREQVIGEMTALAERLARDCGIREIRTSNHCDDIPVGRVFTSRLYKLVGACRDNYGVRRYGFYKLMEEHEPWHR